MLLSLILVWSSACIDDSVSAEDQGIISTRMESRSDVSAAAAKAATAAETCAAVTPIIIYVAEMDCPAWRHPADECSNRNELTLQGAYPEAFPDPDNPFQLLRGLHYDVCPVTSLPTGIPASAQVIIIESNHLGDPLAANSQRSLVAQSHLTEFMQSRGGTVVAHLADSAPAGFGYLVPGLSGPAVDDGDSNALHVAAIDHPFVLGPDGNAGTDDDADDTSIAWLAGESAHQGSLSGVLPSSATVLISGAEDRPIYAEYPMGVGKAIVTTITLEFGNDYNIDGDHFGFGNRNRLLFNHFSSAFLTGITVP